MNVLNKNVPLPMLQRAVPPQHRPQHRQIVVTRVKSSAKKEFVQIAQRVRLCSILRLVKKYVDLVTSVKKATLQPINR